MSNDNGIDIGIGIKKTRPGSLVCCFVRRE
jgi:hypothetical protein